jgi:UDP-N-acetylmuramate: L-alanyl-gamma-D-glutamyl-meso-diaminopimelate ligase
MPQLMVIEGDEYLTSALDPIPKFLKYHPHIALITGISWDHINVFPTFETYLNQFQLFVDSIQKEGTIIFFKQDEVLQDICEKSTLEKIPYNTPHYHIRNGQTIISKQDRHTLNIFGEHNIQNAEGACKICIKLGISESDFYESLKDFTGTAKRLEKIKESENFVVIRDFAHSPSKLKASMNAVRNQYPEHTLIAVYELHTYSSLNKSFLPEYVNSMKDGDINFIYFNPKVIEHKKLPPINPEEIESNFGTNTEAINDIEVLQNKIKNSSSNVSQKPCVLLLMSSGNFDNAQLWY